MGDHMQAWRGVGPDLKYMVLTVIGKRNQPISARNQPPPRVAPLGQINNCAVAAGHLLCGIGRLNTGHSLKCALLRQKIARGAERVKIMKQYLDL